MNKDIKKISIIMLILLCCIIMAIIETIIEPTYFIKSFIKIIVFLLIPLLFMNIIKEKTFDKNYILNKKEIIRLLSLGIGIYLIIMIGYTITNNIFDYTSLVNSLSEDQKVNSNNFIWIALYISFGNSFLEEFLFRMLAFIKLSKFTTKKFSYIFSSFMFAIYHIAMIAKSFPFPLLLLSLIGLIAGGYIFNYLDDKNKNIYNSWIVHMFADFAIMTIWFINI